MANVSVATSLVQKEKLKGCVERSTVTDVRLGEHPKRPLIVQMEAVDRKKRNRTFNFSFSSATERLEWLQVLRVWAGVDSVASPSTMKRLPTLQNVSFLFCHECVCVCVCVCVERTFCGCIHFFLSLGCAFGCTWCLS